MKEYEPMMEHKIPDNPILEDIEYLMDRGEHLDNIVRRCGFKDRNALNNYLKWHAPKELLERFARKSDEQRMHMYYYEGINKLRGGRWNHH